MLDGTQSQNWANQLVKKGLDMVIGVCLETEEKKLVRDLHHLSCREVLKFGGELNVNGGERISGAVDWSQQML